MFVNKLRDISFYIHKDSQIFSNCSRASVDAATEAERKRKSVCVRFVWNVTVLSKLHDEIEIIMHNRFRRRPFMCWAQGVVISYTVHKNLKNHKACSQLVRTLWHAFTYTNIWSTQTQMSVHTSNLCLLRQKNASTHRSSDLVNISLPCRVWNRN